MKGLSVQIKSAGYCTASESHAISGGSRKSIKFYASYAIIHHPKHGLVLFDTGYTRRFYNETKNWPYKIYALATKVYVGEEEELINVLKEEGIDAPEVKFIIVSHFHADHIGGLRDFPNATFICCKDAFEDVKGKKGISALRKGFIPNLLPSDFESRCRFIAFANAEINDNHLGPLIDLFEDGSILLCRLDGHAKGQMGAMINTEPKTFLVADGAWLKANYTELRFPNPIVKLFFDSWSDYKNSLKGIHDYHKANPETIIMPCHCEESLMKYRS